MPCGLFGGLLTMTLRVSRFTAAGTGTHADLRRRLADLAQTRASRTSIAVGLLDPQIAQTADVDRSDLGAAAAAAMADQLFAPSRRWATRRRC